MSSRTTTIVKIIERATSDILPIPDLDLNLQIIDLVNSQPEIGPSLADALVQRLSTEKNEHIINLCFELMEMLLKNSAVIYPHIGSKKVVCSIQNLATGHENFKIKEKAIDFIQFYGNVFQYRKDLHFYPSLVAIKTKNVVFPVPRDDPWKPDGFKRSEETPCELTDTITSTNLYYKINQLKSTKQLLDEFLGNLSYGEENPVLKDLYSQALNLHKNFGIFIQESGLKCQEKVLDELLLLNEKLADSIKQYQSFRKDPSLLKKRDEQRQRALGNNVIIPQTKKKEVIPDKLSNNKVEANLIGDLIQIGPPTTTTTLPITPWNIGSNDISTTPTLIDPFKSAIPSMRENDFLFFNNSQPNNSSTLPAYSVQPNLNTQLPVDLFNIQPTDPFKVVSNTQLTDPFKVVSNSQLTVDPFNVFSKTQPTTVDPFNVFSKTQPTTADPLKVPSNTPSLLPISSFFDKPPTQMTGQTAIPSTLVTGSTSLIFPTTTNPPDQPPTDDPFAELALRHRPL